jgi:hypothetical protein
MKILTVSYRQDGILYVWKFLGGRWRLRAA